MRGKCFFSLETFLVLDKMVVLARDDAAIILKHMTPTLVQGSMNSFFVVRAPKIHFCGKNFIT